MPKQCFERNWDSQFGKPTNRCYCKGNPFCFRLPPVFRFHF